MKRYRGVLIFLAIALLALAGAVWYYNRMLGYLCLGAAGFVTLIVFLLLIGVARKQQQLMDTVVADNDTAASELIRKVDIPVLLMDLNGKIVWRNDALAAVFDGKNVLDVLPNFKPAQPTVQQILLSGTNYQVMTMPVRRRNARKKLLFQYWLDRTEAAHYQRLYTEQMPYVMLVYMDNYEELAGDRQFHGTAVLAEVERLVSELCRRTGGIYRRYENGRFLCVLEAAEVTKIEKEKFKLLEQARHLETGTGATLSLSVAVGMAPRIAQSEEGARTARSGTGPTTGSTAAASSRTPSKAGSRCGSSPRPSASSSRAAGTYSSWATRTRTWTAWARLWASPPACSTPACGPSSCSRSGTTPRRTPSRRWTGWGSAKSSSSPARRPWRW